MRYPRLFANAVGLAAAAAAMGVALGVAGRANITNVVAAGEGGRLVVVVASFAVVFWAGTYVPALRWAKRRARDRALPSARVIERTP